MTTPQLEVRLPEFLHSSMDILFLALNAPEVSNSNGHWFSRNRSFWNVLFSAGLVTQRLASPLTADETVFGGQSLNYRHSVYGVTDLNRRLVATDSSTVDVHEADVVRVLGILDDHPTKVLCLVHNRVAKAFEDAGLIARRGAYGATGRWQAEYGSVGAYGTTRIYEMPFHNASILKKHLHYKKLLAEL